MVTTLGVGSTNVPETVGKKTEDAKTAANGVGVVLTLRMRSHATSGVCKENTATRDSKGATLISCLDPNVVKWEPVIDCLTKIP